MIKISIVTVVFNAVNEIENTIKSVIDQSYDNIEYAIIDGGSTDGTLELIDKYKKDVDILVSESDSGIYDAMNKSLELIGGDWILFLNAGDTLLHNNIIMQVVDRLKSINRDSVHMIGGGVIFDVNGRRIESHVKDLSERWVCMPACHQSLFIKTDIHRKYKYNIHYKICADHDFFIKMISKGYGFEEIELFVSIFKFNGLSANNRISMYKEKLEIVKKYNGPIFSIISIWYMLIRLNISKILRVIRVKK
jgi:glycosyltransferase involved in cell wall biosynthesis